MLLGKRLQQSVHLSARLRVESPFLRAVVRGYDIWYFSNRIGFVTRRVSVCIRHLVRGDSVHESHERATLVLVPGKRRHHREAHLLRHVVRRQLASFGSTDPGPAIPHDQRADTGENLGQSVPVTLRGSGD